MTWLTKLRTILGHDEQEPVPPNGDSAHEAQEALRNAKAALNSAQVRREEVRKVTVSLANLRERNHFGESIQLAMMPREKRV